MPILNPDQEVFRHMKIKLTLFGKCIIIALILTACLLMASCNSFTDVVSSNAKLNLNNPPAGTYGHVAWLSEHQIAFQYSPKLEPRSGDYQLELYELGTKEWHIVSQISDEICPRGTIRWLNRLPTGELGFISECDLQSRGIYNVLYAWNNETNNLRRLRQFAGDDNFHTGDYTFTPDMTQLVQTRINAKAFSVDTNGNLTPILANYNLIDSPRWSPDGKILAFAASTASDVMSLEPWNIILQRGSQQSTTIMSGVQFAAFIKWSPLGRWLSFRGKYQGLDGIWVLDTQTLQLTRVWDDQSFYDWSPDGKHMVVIERTKRAEIDGEDRTLPIIIDMPPQLYQSTS